MEKIIEISNLKKQIRTGRMTVDILKDINLEVEKGEFLAIMGASGSGKSTLLSILAGIDDITSGKVVVYGNEINNYNEKDLALYRNSNIGMVFQNFNLINELNSFENVLIPSFFRKHKGNIKDRVNNLIDMVGMKGKEKLYPAQLSGGEQQRIAIARALLCDPPILLADEPTGALDSVTGEQMINIFKKCKDELGTTIVMVTHEAEIANKADRIIQIRDGEVV